MVCELSEGVYASTVAGGVGDGTGVGDDDGIAAGGSGGAVGVAAVM